MWVMEHRHRAHDLTGDDGSTSSRARCRPIQPLSGLEVVLLSRATSRWPGDHRRRRPRHFAAGLLKGRGAARAAP